MRLVTLDFETWWENVAEMIITSSVHQHGLRGRNHLAIFDNESG